MTPRASRLLRAGLILTPVAIALTVVLASIVEAAHVSVRPVLGAPATLAAWRAVANDTSVQHSVTFTLAMASVSALLATLVALVGYLSLQRIRALWAWALLLLPALLPHIVAGLVIVAWVGPGGVLDHILDTRPIELYRDALGAGSILAYVWKESAFVLMLLIAGTPRDLRAREEMARTSGLGPLQTLRSVTLPALARAALVGCATVLVFAIGALEIPALVGPSSPQTLAEATVNAMSLDVFTGQSTAAAIAITTAALAVLVVAVLLAAVAVIRAAQRRDVRRVTRLFATGTPT